MATAAVYRTSDSGILAAYDARVEQDAQRTEAQKQLLIELGAEGEKLYGTKFYDGTFHIRGVTWPKGKPAPEGWRIPAKAPRRIEPIRNIKVGKQIDKRLSEISTRGVKLGIGMVDSVSGPIDKRTGTSMTYWFGLTRVDDTLWVSWEFDPDEDRHNAAEKINPLWEKVPLSEYFALVEAGNDPFARPEPNDD